MPNYRGRETLAEARLHLAIEARKEKPKGPHMVHLADAYFTEYITRTIILPIIFILTMFIPYNIERLIFQLILGAVILFIIGFLLFKRNWLIVMEDEYFTYRDIWRKSHEIRYSSITGIRPTEKMIHIYTETKHIYLNPISAGLDEFKDKIGRQHFKFEPKEED